MSDLFTTFIPVDPFFVPTVQAQRDAIALLRKLSPNAEDVSSRADEHVLFRDCGGNFERVRCGSCGGEIAVETLQNWMSEDFSDDGFSLGPIETPCCRTTTSLNQLQYEWPQGFSRYALSARSVDTEICAAIHEFEAAIGCSLRVIRQRI
jgi:hypothetical protein